MWLLPISALSQALLLYRHWMDQPHYSHDYLKSGLFQIPSLRTILALRMNSFKWGNKLSHSLYRDCMPTSITLAVRFLWHYCTNNYLWVKATQELCHRPTVPTGKWSSNLFAISGSSSGARTLLKVSFRSCDKEDSEGAKRGDNRSADAKAKWWMWHLPSTKDCGAGLGNTETGSASSQTGMHHTLYCHGKVKKSKNVSHTWGNGLHLHSEKGSMQKLNQATSQFRESWGPLLSTLFTWHIRARKMPQTALVYSPSRVCKSTAAKATVSFNLAHFV